MNFYLIIILLIHCCNGIYRQYLVNRKTKNNIPHYPRHHITPEQVLQKDKNGNCIFPPLCNLDTAKCNIPKVAIDDMTFSKFYHEFYIPKKPVIIQFCANKSLDCDLSSVIDGPPGFNFEWHKIAKILLPKDRYKFLLNVQKNGTILDRTNVTVIEELDMRHPNVLVRIMYDSIRQPQFFDQIDIFNDLIGYLSSSDAHNLFHNKWAIFGVAGGGATFHFDYYFTSFWNIVISGSKYWIMMEPEDVLRVWNDSDLLIHRAQKLDNFEFFDQMYANGFLQEQYKQMGRGHTLYECVQQKGDMMYNPPIYFHITVNLEQSLSMSQNIISKQDYAETFKLITGIRANRYRRLDDWREYKIWDAMHLCAALNNYDSELFDKSACADRMFLRSLDKPYHDNDRANSRLYMNNIQYSRDHARYSDFV